MQEEPLPEQWAHYDAAHVDAKLVYQLEASIFWNSNTEVTKAEITPNVESEIWSLLTLHNAACFHIAEVTINWGHATCVTTNHPRARLLPSLTHFKATLWKYYLTSDGLSNSYQNLNMKQTAMSTRSMKQSMTTIRWFQSDDANPIKSNLHFPMWPIA